MSAIGFLFIIFSVAAAYVIGASYADIESSVKRFLLILLPFVFSFIGAIIMVVHGLKEGANYYVNNQELYQVDAVRINNMIDHYEIKIKE